MNSFKNDYNSGLKEELNVFKLLKVIDPTIKLTPPSCVIDFVSDNYIYELKKRNCNKNTYPTTIIGYNKLIYADKQKKELILLFSFKDGLYYCKYDNSLNFEKNEFVRNARSDYNDKSKEYVFIPITELLHFSTIEKTLGLTLGISLKDQFDCPTPAV